jgi:hypothetical protein
MSLDSKKLRAHRVAAVIHAVCAACKLQAHVMMGTLNNRDLKGCGARYAIWWVCYFRLGMKQSGIGSIWKMTSQGIATGIRRAGEMVEDNLEVCLALDAADRAAARALKKHPLEGLAAERVLRLSPRDWREPRKITTPTQP